VPLPGSLARFNRRVTNPLLAPFAARLPGFAIVEHRGRVSGRVYRNPVNAFEDRDGFVLALTYGRDVDWVRNVLAAGGCRLLRRGRTIPVTRPRLVPMSSVREAIPAPVRALLRQLDVADAMRLDRA
jgi:deazaflavin-dependent oxidoreductase (nitroreductase family)